jgi:hypothetical protein
MITVLLLNKWYVGEYFTKTSESKYDSLLEMPKMCDYNKEGLPNTEYYKLKF